MGITVPATIGKVTQLEVSGGTTITLGTVDLAAIASGGWDAPTAITVTARANSLWGATIASTTGTFAAPCGTKAASTLHWGRSSGTRTTLLSTTSAALFPLASNAATAGTVQLVYLRLQVGWTTDPPRSCAIGLAFAITAP